MTETAKILELDKVISKVKEYAVLQGARALLDSVVPERNFDLVKHNLNLTEEADKLLFVYRIGGIDFFELDNNCLIRAEKGAQLNAAEILSVYRLLKSSRILKNSICKDEFTDIVLLKDVCLSLYTDTALEKDISSKIISDDEIADTASQELYSLRQKIKKLNFQIKEKLNLFLIKNSSYIQDSIITTRSGRYVIPIKSQYKNSVKGLIHDQSSSGATFFIEPEQVFILNNELRSAETAEKNEIDRILAELSLKIGSLVQPLLLNIDTVCFVDSFYARAYFAYKTNCVKPSVNNLGYIKINKGRHPLISKEKVVPLSFEVGTTFNFLLISGANAGGKTVSLKLCGLFALMTACGLYLPCAQADIAVYDNIFCDIGDKQSIENELSTFSSHITAVKEITERADSKSLVLIDELGDGTDSQEGEALALSVLLHLIEKRCKGIITTHFSALKEYALSDSRILNAAMEFDFIDLKPLYKISLGLPGSSNALIIAKRLGLDDKITEKAKRFLSDEKIAFDNILNSAQQRRLQAENKINEIDKLKSEIDALHKSAADEFERLSKERETIAKTSRQEIKRAVIAKSQTADEYLNKIIDIAGKDVITGADVITARTLRNKLDNERYLTENDSAVNFDLVKVDGDNLIEGQKVYVKQLGKNARVLSINAKKGTAEVEASNLKLSCKIKDLYRPQSSESAKKDLKDNRHNLQSNRLTKISGQVNQTAPILELNIIGHTVIDAESKLDEFLDSAVVSRLSEVKIIHGRGTGILRRGVRSYLKAHPLVDSFRSGSFGEGEDGVTVVLLK